MKNELHKLLKVSTLFHHMVPYACCIDYNKCARKKHVFLLVNKDVIVSEENFKNCTFKTKKIFI